MDKRDRNAPENTNANDDLNSARGERQSSVPGDLPDSKHDQERLQPDEVTFDLPDVSDIPGQENVNVLPLGELGDTTISSDDEEGGNLFDDDRNNNTQ